MKIERILIEDQMAPIGLDEKKTGIFLAADGRRRRTESDAERMPDRCAHRRRYCVGQRKNGNRRINRDWL